MWKCKSRWRQRLSTTRDPTGLARRRPVEAVLGSSQLAPALGKHAHVRHSPHPGDVSACP